jgi:hypothetical protein
MRTCRSTATSRRANDGCSRCVAWGHVYIRLSLQPVGSLISQPPCFKLYRTASRCRNDLACKVLAARHSLPTPATRSGQGTKLSTLTRARFAENARLESIDGLSDGLPGESALLDASQLASPSAELRELAHLQLGLLVAALEARLGEFAETGVRCAVYCRNPASLAAGHLQLQLVAATDGREAEAARQRQDLILGIPTADGQVQEAWLIEQPLIVLPDSGGLVLPLAHNGFLVGLLVVERCGPDLSSSETTSESNQRNQPRFSGAGGAPASLQPPACAVFQPSDMTLVKQAGAALGLACTMDLRSSIESAGHQLQNRMVQGIVSEVRKPLGTLRTLSAMLTPRLREGEPEKDLGEGILAQGQKLGELVMQLQQALAPPIPTIVPGKRSGGAYANGLASMPTVLLDASERQRAARQTQKGSSEGPSEAQVRYPALPSSTIGSDWGGLAGDRAPEETSDAHSEATPLTPGEQAVEERKDSGDTVASSESNDAQMLSGGAHVVTHLSRLRSMLTPLLSAVAKFAVVSGVRLIPVDSSGCVQAEHNIPDVIIPADGLVLKRLLGQLLDGMMACSSRGDCIEFAVEEKLWQGSPGVLISVRLMQAAGFAAAELDGQLMVEVGALTNLARHVGGWFDLQMHEEFGTRPLATVSSNRRTNVVGPMQAAGTVAAALWLPIDTASRQAS